MIGVAVARALLADPACKILLLTYTNHALDQFLLSLLDAGVPMHHLLRVGRRCTNERLRPVSQFEMQRGTGPPPLDRQEQHRRFALIEEADRAKQRLWGRWCRLMRISWATPKKVPATELRDAIEVRCHSVNTLHDRLGHLRAPAVVLLVPSWWG